MENAEVELRGLLPEGHYRTQDIASVGENFVKVTEYEDLETGEVHYLSALVFPVETEEGIHQQTQPFEIDAEGPVEALDLAIERAEELVKELTDGQVQEASESVEEPPDSLKEAVQNAASSREEKQESSSDGPSVFDIEDLRR